METTAATATKPSPSIGLFPFLLLYALLAVLQSLFPMLAFGTGFYGALSMRLSGWALLLELAAPLLFGGALLAALLLLRSWRSQAGQGFGQALAVKKPGEAIFLALVAVCAALTVYPENHIGYGFTGAPYFIGMALSFLWQAAVAVGFAVIPVHFILSSVQRKTKPGTAAWAAFGIMLLVQALAMAAFRLLWQAEAHPANLLLLDVLPNAIAPVLIGMMPVMLSILVCQRSRRGSIWPAAFAAAASSALWALLAPKLGAVLGSMGLVDSTYLVLVHLVFFVVLLVVFAVMSLTIARKLRKKVGQSISQ